MFRTVPDILYILLDVRNVNYHYQSSKEQIQTSRILREDSDVSLCQSSTGERTTSIQLPRFSYASLSKSMYNPWDNCSLLRDPEDQSKPSQAQISDSELWDNLCSHFNPLRFGVICYTAITNAQLE